MQKKPFVRLLLFLMLVVLIVACRDETPEEAATLPPATAVATATTPVEATPLPSPTVPPALTPTIVIPTVEPEPGETATPQPPAPETNLPEALRFATFRETAVDTTPAIFHDPIAPDLSNVTVPFVLSQEQLDRLAADGLVVSPGVEKEFFTVYEQARYANVPTFITSDSLLHVYHLLFDKVLRTAERQSFIPLLQQLNQAMLAQTDAQYQALQGTEWEDAALRTVAFIGVGSKLMDPATEVPAYAQELMDAELANIEAASGIMPSPLFPGLENGEDYTQYIPRGHYTISEELTAYFKSMMWYGRMTFRLKTDNPDVGRAETRAALLLVHALRTAQVSGQPALQAWLDLYNPTVFFVGRSDDLTAFQYLEVIDTVYGATPDLATIADESQLDTFIEAANELPPPQILGLVISVGDDVEETTKGFRFMGQRFVPDAYIFRQLIYRNVGTSAEPRMLPKGLDVMAAMGSDRAYAILDELGETEYANYPEQMDKMQTWVDSLTTDEWTETLYTTWLYTFEPLLAEPGAGYPQFMQSEAWLDKQLNTSLGSWAELKHDTILYAKQVYAELGGGGGAPVPLPARGYVEPVPEFFARLEALTTMTLDGLQQRGLLSEQDLNSLARLQSLATALQLMAEKELRGEPLTEEEFNLIRFYGGELEHLTMAAADREDEDPFAQPIMDEEPQAAVVADVATAPDPDGDGIPNPVVLEEAVGRINEIYVVVPLINDDGTIQLQVAKGGVFAYYEFPWPADDRLTDEKWRTMLDEGTAPALPEWTNSFFTTATEYAAFQRAIYSFQSSISQAYWDLEPTYLYAASEAVQNQFAPELDALRAASQYIGRQWISASYRSFDIQAEDRVVVTVRENWEDALYSFTDYPGEGGDPSATRGPYTLDVTYTLERVDNRWLVTNVVYNNQPPAWE
ncbi:MAG: DUF3160 domain-containing protein [Ardenticatenaceae bacterium]|nr:DUF3160 domain-containing protein [Ardenticatenaceae bacterium]